MAFNLLAGQTTGWDPLTGPSNATASPPSPLVRVATNSLIEILVDAIGKEAAVRIQAATGVPEMCRTQIGCAVIAPWCAWERGWQALQV
jgi:hypothetical protein